MDGILVNRMDGIYLNSNKSIWNFFNGILDNEMDSIFLNYRTSS